MKKIASLFIAWVMIIAFSSITVSAHNMDDCGYKHTATTTHWDIFEDTIHWGSYASTITVDCGIFEGHSFENYIGSAVNTWNAATFNNRDLLTMTVNNTSGSVLFRNKSAEQMAEIAGSTTWAVVYRSGAEKDSSNYEHYNTSAGSVEIWINWNDVLVNKSTTAKTHVPLHELGHVIGLKDIPSSASINSYLMCNEFGNSTPPTVITNADKQGAAVILGQHTSHNFVYTNYSSTAHKKYCTICGIYNYYKHTYSNNTCTKCGDTQ